MQAPPNNNTAPKCAGNCGFYGSPATDGYCSVCYRRRLLLQQEQAQQQQQRPTKQPTSEDHQTSETAAPLVLESEAPPPTSEVEVAAKTRPSMVDSNKKIEQADPSRCYKCTKRVGLLGFKCRCGAVCCRTHLHAEEHGCTFDYQQLAKTTLESRNPRVVHDKLDRI